MTSSASPRHFWTPVGRSVVFLLAATSIWCLLVEFYGLCSMRVFTLAVSLPAMTGLVALVALDAMRGDGVLGRQVLRGAVGGLVAAVAYDIFRLPFVYANEWGLASVVPPMNLFKVFPRFGAMILGEPIEQKSYSVAAQVIGWAYHFSNGLTFGVMYAALVGTPQRRHWLWAVVMAVGLEMGMVLSPYPRIFGIHLGATFFVVTMAAHLIFGVVLGLWYRGNQATTNVA